MPLSDLLCIENPLTQPACVTLPLGIEVCTHTGLDVGDPTKVLRDFLAQINSILAPLAPIFLIADIVVAVIDCISAIKDALGPPPDPSKITGCIAKLQDLLAQLLQILPPVTIPRAVKQITYVLILTVIAIKSDLQAIIRQNARVLAAATLAARPGNFALQAAVDCAQRNADVQLQNLNESLQPLNRLLGLVNLFLDLAQVPDEVRIPDFAELGNDAEDALDVMDAALVPLQAVYDFLPG